ncbi:MAG: LamG-like jellyroll fold domain-containing protein [Bryobacteraceae bacterium]
MRPLLVLFALAPMYGQRPDGLLFYASLRQSFTAEHAAGVPQPLQSSGVMVNDAADLPPGARLTYDARANIYAEQGTVSFWWRPEAASGRVSFPLLLVSYEQHSTWDFNFMRIAWTGSELTARLTDRNYVTQSVRGPIKPEAGQWVHIAVGWSESDGLAFYINGKLAGRLARPLELDAALDQFGLVTAAVTPHHTSGNENAGAIREVRIYRAPLDGEDVARLAAGEQPAGAVRRQTPWAARFGWSENARVPVGGTFKVTRIPVAEAKDLGKFWLKGADGKRET